MSHEYSATALVKTYIKTNSFRDATFINKTTKIVLDLNFSQDGFKAPVKLLLPPHMEEGAQYPLLV